MRGMVSSIQQNEDELPSHHCPKKLNKCDNEEYVILDE